MRTLGAWIIAALTVAWACALPAPAAASPHGHTAFVAAAVAPASSPAGGGAGHRAAAPAPSAEEADGADGDELGLDPSAPASAVPHRAAAGRVGLAAAEGTPAPGSLRPATGPPAA